MATERSYFHLTDERALEALTHPIRSRLMSLLRIDGPATASRLGERIGESSGVTSYHLRKLAEVGLVKEDVERGTRKERWWRSAHEGTRWSPADFVGNPAAHQATIAMRRNYYAWQARLLEHRLHDEENWDKAWVDAAYDSDDHLVLTPEQTKAMAQEIWAVVQRYREQGDVDAPDAARVIWFQHAVPFFGELPV